MFIDTTLLVDDPAIIQGLQDGSLKRFGGVIRETATGRIVRHLLETPGLTDKLMTLPLNPILGGADLVTDVVSHGITINKLGKIQDKLSSVLNLTQIAAGASILNLGVSIAGFTYMGFKLHQIQNALDNVQKSLEEGFNRVEKDQKWTYRQIAIAEYLDAKSELLARLESIQAFADTCKSRGAKSSLDILPDGSVEPGLYTLPAS